MSRKLIVEQLESRALLTSFTPVQLADISPGTSSTSFSNFSFTDEHLYFNANGTQLWRTDGSPAGTAYLGDVRPDTVYSSRQSPADLGDGMAVFNVRDGNDYSIWKTDGTTEGTHEFLANRRYDYPLVRVNDEWSIAILSNNDQQREIWRFGTNEDSAQLLLTLDDAGYEQEVVILNDQAYISLPNNSRSVGPYRLIRTDGTLEGTEVLTDSLASPAVVDADSNLHYQLGRDGKTIWYQLRNGKNVPEEIFTLPGHVQGVRYETGKFLFFFSAEADFPLNWQLGFSDGTDAGTSYWTSGHSIGHQWFDTQWFGELGSDLLFGSGDLFRTNGTPEGTVFVAEGQYQGQIGGHVYLGTGPRLFSPWQTLTAVTNGKDVYDVWTGQPIPTDSRSEPSIPAPPSQSFGFSEAQGLVRQSNQSGGSGPSYYRVSYFLPDKRGVLQKVPVSSTSAERFQIGSSYYIDDVSQILADNGTVVQATTRYDFEQESLDVAEAFANDGVYFSYGPPEQQSLWLLRENSLVSRIGPVKNLSTYENPGEYFFTRETAATGHELWVTRGTPDDIVAIDIWPGEGSSNPEFVRWNGHNIVIADSPGFGRELWSIESVEQTAESPIMDVRLASQFVIDGDSAEFHAEVVDATATRFSWDLNNDGDFDDATGANPTLTNEQLNQLDPPIPRNVDVPYHVSVATVDGDSIVRTSLLRIENPAPVISDALSVPAGLRVGDELSLELLGTDDDALTFTVDFGDGTIEQKNSPSFSHVYQAMGRHTLKISVEDVHRSVTTRQYVVEVLNPGSSWIFTPGHVFGDDSQTTDLALTNEDFDYQGTIDRIITASPDAGNASHFPPTSTVDEFFTLRVPAYVPNAHVVAIGSGFNPDIIFATQDGLFGTDGAWDFGQPSVEISDVVIGDLNGDGAQDAYVANLQLDDGSAAADYVLLRREDNLVDPQTNRYLRLASLVGMDRSRSVELADFNGDGTVDVVTAGSETVDVWFNDGNAEFAASEQQLDASASYVATGDLDQDGDQDLVASVDGHNLVWLNDGTGHFVQTEQRLGNANSAHVALGDLDGDQDLDAMFANGPEEPTTVWLNDGTGLFQDSGARLATALDATRIVLEDLEGDGGLDAVVAIAGAANLVYHTPPDTTAPTVVDYREVMTANGLQSIMIEFSEPVSGYLELQVSGPNFSPNAIWNSAKTAMTADFSELEIPFGTYRLNFRYEDRGNNNLEWSERPRQIDVYRAGVGDLNRDEKVDDRDYETLKRNFGKPLDREERGDINGDGKVDFADFLLLSKNYGK